MNHRVKNNPVRIQSILQMAQDRQAQNPGDTASVLADIQNRLNITEMVED